MMITLIIYDGVSGVYYQVLMNDEQAGNVHALLPRDNVLMFTIEDDVEVLSVDGGPIESRSL